MQSKAASGAAGALHEAHVPVEAPQQQLLRPHRLRHRDGVDELVLLALVAVVGEDGLAGVHLRQVLAQGCSSQGLALRGECSTEALQA